jgi:hypothetical protein
LRGGLHHEGLGLDLGPPTAGVAVPDGERKWSVWPSYLSAMRIGGGGKGSNAPVAISEAKVASFQGTGIGMQ